MNYVFTRTNGELLGKADEQLNPVGKPFELLNRIPRVLPVRYGGHEGNTFTENSVDQSVNDEGFELALRDWCMFEGIILDYER